MNKGTNAHPCRGPGRDLNRRRAAVEAVWKCTGKWNEENKAERLSSWPVDYFTPKDVSVAVKGLTGPAAALGIRLSLHCIGWQTAVCSFIFCCSLISWDFLMFHIEYSLENLKFIITFISLNFITISAVWSNYL